MGADIPQDAVADLPNQPQSGDDEFAEQDMEATEQPVSEEPISAGSETLEPQDATAEELPPLESGASPEQIEAYRQQQARWTPKFQAVAEQRRTLEERQQQLERDAEAVRTAQQQLNQTFAQLSQPQPQQQIPQSQVFAAEAQRLYENGDEMGARQMNIAAQQALSYEQQLGVMQQQIGILTQAVHQQRAVVASTGLTVQEQQFLSQHPDMAAYKDQVVQMRQKEPWRAHLSMREQYLYAAGDDLLAKGKTVENRVRANKQKHLAAVVPQPGRGTPGPQLPQGPDDDASLDEIWKYAIAHPAEEA